MLRLKSGEKAALLHVRGSIDPETGKSESFAGATQVTVHGNAIGHEPLSAALHRESAEELGEMLLASGENMSVDEGLLLHLPEHLQILSYRNSPAEKVVTLGGLIKNPEMIRRLWPMLQSGQLRLLRESQLPQVRTIGPDYREKHIPAGVVAMFPDELEALKKAFSESFEP
jgi:hypothetical protein